MYFRAKLKIKHAVLTTRRYTRDVAIVEYLQQGRPDSEADRQQMVEKYLAEQERVSQLLLVLDKEYEEAKLRAMDAEGGWSCRHLSEVVERRREDSPEPTGVGAETESPKAVGKTVETEAVSKTVKTVE